MPSPAPLTMLTWLTRYTPAALAALHDAGSILDAGCGPPGLACIAPDVPFVGAAPLDHDDEFTATHIADLVARAAAPAELPA